MTRKGCDGEAPWWRSAYVSVFLRWGGTWGYPSEAYRKQEGEQLLLPGHRIALAHSPHVEKGQSPATARDREY
jgi:hypothetical protein